MGVIRTFIRSIKATALIMVVIVAIVSCKKESSDYITVIPADAGVIVSVNIQSLLDKSGFNDSDKKQVSGLLTEGLSGGAAELVEKIVNDGNESGVSIKDPVYFFMNESTDEPVIAFKVNDMAKLKHTMAVLEEEELITVDGEHRFSFSGDASCIFNEKVLLASRADMNRLTALLEQPADKSIAGSESFKAMSNKKGELQFFLKTSAIPELSKQLDLFGVKSADFNPELIVYVGGVTFENGKIDFTAETVSDDAKTKELIAQQMAFQGNLKQTFLSYYPLNSLMYASFNLDGKRFNEFLEQHKEMFGKIGKEEQKILFEVLSTIKGDISFGISDLTMQNASMTLYAEVDTKAVKEILDKYAATAGLSKNKEDYIMKTPMGMSVFLGCKDNFFFATTSETAYNTIGTQMEKSLKDASYASHMKGLSQYVAVDVKNILENPMVKMLTAFGGSEVATYLNMVSKVTLIEATADKKEAGITIWLSDDKTNSLKQIVNMARQYAGI